MTVAFDLRFAREETIDELLHKQWYSVPEICELFRFSPATVRRAARSGELQATIIDHQVYGVRRDHLITWLRGRQAH